ncbi:hypothetical protein F6S25_26055 [Klebsiella pneumoniae]|nr:recombinase family protein [Klebsiella pneumoniae]MDT9670201.1 hypothetical protein [Klebsiella pneumoniae]
MFVFGYLRASTSEQDASRAKNVLKAFANQHGHRIAGWYRGLTLSGTKTHVKQRFLPLTPLLMVSDVLWSPVLPA